MAEDNINKSFLSSALWRTALCFVLSLALAHVFSHSSFLFPGECWKTGSYHKFSLRQRNVMITTVLHTTGPIFQYLLENRVTVRFDCLIAQNQCIGLCRADSCTAKCKRSADQEIYTIRWLLLRSKEHAAKSYVYSETIEFTLSHPLCLRSMPKYLHGA